MKKSLDMLDAFANGYAKPDCINVKAIKDELQMLALEHTLIAQENKRLRRSYDKLQERYNELMGRR